MKPDGELADDVASALARYLGARQPLWQAVTRWPQAIPQYTLGHLQRMRAIEEAERELPGLHFCANWRGGVSVADCIKSAHGTVEAVVRSLSRSPATAAP